MPTSRDPRLASTSTTAMPTVAASSAAVSNGLVQSTTTNHIFAVIDGGKPIKSNLKKNMCNKIYFKNKLTFSEPRDFPIEEVENSFQPKGVISSLDDRTFPGFLV